MAARQESVSNWMELAKAYDKAERNREVTPYVVVSLQNQRTDANYTDTTFQGKCFGVTDG